jgi:hypothetical protein
MVVRLIRAPKKFNAQSELVLLLNYVSGAENHNNTLNKIIYYLLM